MIRASDFLPPGDDPEDLPGKGHSGPEIPPWVPFPVETLPEAVAGFVGAVASGLGTDSSMVALPVLGALAGAIGNTRCAELRPGWREPSCLWVGLTAESGSMKSPVFDAVFKPFWDLHGLRNAAHQSALAEHARTVELMRRNKSSDPLPDPPKLERSIVGDVTIQKAAEILAENPRGLLAVFDELAGWFSGLTRYAKSGTDLPQWLSLHSGAALAVDRKGGASIFVRRALVSIAGGIQPGVLARHLNPEAQESGLAARWLFACPPRTPKRWRTSGVDQGAAGRWDRLIGDLLELTMGDDGGPLPITLDPEARECWVGWFEKHAARQATATGPWASFLSKMEAGAARLALILHVADLAARRRVDPCPMPRWAMESGTRLADWFIGERARIEALLATKPKDQGGEPSGNGPGLADRLGELLRAAGPSGLTLTEAQNKTHRNYSSDDLRGALADLERRGLARVKIETTGEPGRPTTRWGWVG